MVASQKTLNNLGLFYKQSIDQVSTNLHKKILVPQVLEIQMVGLLAYLTSRFDYY
jgi:hypothetical protein